jgi:hypothetical protein
MRRMFRATVSAALSTALAVFFGITFASPAQAAQTRDLFKGNSFGSSAFVGKSVVSGPTAFVGLGCQVKAGTHVQNTMQSGQEEEDKTGGSMSTGSVATTADAIRSKSTTKTLTRATTHTVNLLKGRITASRVRSSSATFTDGKHIDTSSAGTILADLVVDGDAFELKPGPNTEVKLPNLGYAVLNEQFENTEAPMPFLIVNGIHVYVTQPNVLGIPVGTQYVVSHAFSALKKSVHGSVGGLAFGHKLFEGQRIQSGPSAVVYMPCAGTGGDPVSNTSLGVTHSPTFEVGNVKSTAIGKVTRKSARSELISSVQSVSLLGGLVTAEEIKSRARASKSGHDVTLSDSGSKFVNLVVNGRPIGSETGPNKQIDLPGIGTLWLHRVIEKGKSIEVRMIELVVKEENPFGLKPGSKLLVAVARAVIRR